MQFAIRGEWRRADIPRQRCRLVPLVAAIVLGCSSAGAATIAVNDASGDSTTGLCTLADAVDAINGAQAVNGCTAGDGVSDTIDLSFFTAPTTISFQNPNAPAVQSGIALTKPATITGPVDAGGRPLVTIARNASAATYFRVIGTSANLTLQNVNITGGHLTNARGAGVNATGQANLTITNSTISGNTINGNTPYSGGGVASEYGGITLTGSTVSDNFCTHNGGGVYTLHEGQITVTNSTISGNHAYYYGGGVYSFNGDVTLTGSTVSNNSVFSLYNYNGNIITRDGLGGGGAWVYKSLHMTNSTVSGNYSRSGFSGVDVVGKSYAARPGGIRSAPRAPQRSRPATSTFQSGNAYVYFSTIARNSSNATYSLGTDGMFVENYLHAIGDIFQDNASGNLQFTFAGSVLVGSNNIIGAPQPSQTPAGTPDCDPKLGPLANWGGPTSTLPLLAGSCALDAGPETLSTGITTDQRGLPRVANSIADIGAFEKQSDTDPDLIFDGGFETSG